jgi:hypothetical protein
MHDVALHLAEQVIPAVPLRQWVLTVPSTLRLALARDRALRRAVVSVMVRSIFMLQRRQGRADGLTQVMPGGLIPDGIFAFEPEQPAIFVAAATADSAPARGGARTPNGLRGE